MAKPIAEYDYRLVVFGKPQALKRHRTFRRGDAVGSYDPSRADKKDFVAAVQQSAPAKPLDCPLAVSVRFYFARPKNHYRTGKYAGLLKPNAPLWHTSRPDVDNLLKFVFDSFNSVFWRDDTLICQIAETIKQYSERPRTEVYIKVL